MIIIWLVGGLVVARWFLIGTARAIQADAAYRSSPQYAARLLEERVRDIQAEIDRSGR